MAFEAGGRGAADTPRPPVVPRRSASLLLVRDDPLRVLMLRRGSTRGAFPSALVFPGGVLEPEDSVVAAAHGYDATDEFAALRAAAIRETWEEVGVLLARDPSDRFLTRPQVPTPLAAGAGGLGGVLGAAAARLALDEVVPFGRWITPVEGKRRFDTDFFLARAPEEQEPTADGVEAVALRWVEPAEVPALTNEMLLLPTLMNLRRLGSFGSVSEAIEAAPSLPRVPVTSTVGFDGAGNPVVRIPAEAGYGITEFYPKDLGHFQFER
ncbi:NUDIX domain-containing protein [Leucobacter komagatae]|uniref:NUDIX domain-containing protein n=1 Tax=Leucobacter komagatae TaxID=55969 RepID=A0A542Y5U7_9MICO|nr:NUDIX domain-containing protein [Leucobacter komagatae]TQL43472.1 NUDIX domain-containing protein [Leucobacter komagatae]